MFYVDYEAPIDRLREAFRADRANLRCCGTATFKMQVTGITGQVRYLASARSAMAFDLRCEIREKTDGLRGRCRRRGIVWIGIVRSRLSARQTRSRARQGTPPP
jgi:hypothetical protein